jgi:hypothetical protein
MDTNPVPSILTDHCTRLTDLTARREALAAPFAAQIAAAQAACQEAVSPLEAEMRAEQEAIKPHVERLGHSLRCGPYLAVFQRRNYWDSHGLLVYAVEQPAVLQFRTERMVVCFRRY